MRIHARTGLGIVAAFVLAAAMTALPGRASADAWDPEWQVRVGRSADAVATDAAGNVYVTGTVRSPDGYWRSMVVVKYAGDGTELWRRTWRARSEDFPYSVGDAVAVSADGGTVFVAGAEFIDSTEHARAMLWAYSPAGRLRWHRTMWGSSSFVAEGIGVGPTGVVVGGSISGEYPNVPDGRLVAFADDGTRRWMAPFEVPQVPRATNDAVYDVEVDARGYAYAVGTVERRDVTEDDWWQGIWSDADVVIQRFDPDGRLVWSRLLADPGVKDRDSAFAVDAVGGVVTVAGFRDGSQDMRGHAWLARVSPSGRIAWSRVWGPDLPGSATAWDVVIAPWGEITVVGKDAGALFVRGYSPSGALVSRRHLDGAGATGVAASGEPALYVVGGRSLWRLPAG